MSMIAAVIGRLLLAVMFIVSGLQKIADPGPTAQMLAGDQPARQPRAADRRVRARRRPAAGDRADDPAGRDRARRRSSALTIFFFHNEFADPLQGTLALKNLAIMGGLLMTFAYGQVRGTFDYMRERRKTYDAELRAARAEGRAEGATTAPRTVVADTAAHGGHRCRPRRRARGKAEAALVLTRQGGAE